MQDRAITVNADDRTVVVDGEAYRVGVDARFPEDIQSIQWTPALQREDGRHGYIQRKVGESHGFADFAVIEPYLQLWRSAKTAADLAAKARQEELTEEASAHAEQKAAAEAVRQ